MNFAQTSSQNNSIANKQANKKTNKPTTTTDMILLPCWYSSANASSNHLQIGQDLELIEQGSQNTSNKQTNKQPDMILPGLVLTTSANDSCL
jgi:hypothetical protein